MHSLSVSIVIPTLNRSKSLIKTLWSIKSNSYKKIEIIVIDQSETDDYKIIKDIFENIKYFRTDKKNLPNARNIGIKKSSGDIILFLDDDISADEHLIYEHVKSHNQIFDVGAVTGRVKLVSPDFWKKQDHVVSLDTKTGELNANFDQQNSSYIDFVAGCNFSIKKSVIKNIGLFDTSFLGNAFYEEIDFSLKIKNEGYKIFYNANASLVHYRENSGGCRNKSGLQYYFNKFYNKSYFFMKNYSKNLSLGFYYSIKNEIEFYSRTKKKKHNFLWVFIFFIGALSGAIKGFFKKIF